MDRDYMKRPVRKDTTVRGLELENLKIFICYSFSCTIAFGAPNIIPKVVSIGIWILYMDLRDFCVKYVVIYTPMVVLLSITRN